MKTIEERAQEIADEAFDDWCFDKATKQYKGAFDRDECAAIIRADREAVLRRVTEIGTSLSIAYDNDRKTAEFILINPANLAKLKKEARDES